MALGLRARVIRGRHLHLADGAGGAALVACVALGVVWVFGAVALHAPGTAHLRGRRAALADHAQPQRAAAAVRAGAERPRPRRSRALDRRPGDPGRQARTPRCRRSGRAGGGSFRGPRPRHRLRARRRGLGLGRGARPGRHQRPRRRRRGRHHRDDAGRKVDRRTPVLYDVANDLAILRVAVGLPALPTPRRRAGARTPPSSATPTTAPTAPPPPASGNARRDQRGLLRPRADPALDRLAAGNRAQRQLRRPAGRYPRASPGHRLRDDDLRRPGRASRFPTTSSSPPWREARPAVDTGPCTG